MVRIVSPSRLAIGTALSLALLAPSSFAQDLFYKGKTVRLIVGAPPGGGFDAYSRAISRHIGKYIPGNPIMVVDNMPGAAGLVAANYVYKATRPDGLSAGTFVGAYFCSRCWVFRALNSMPRILSFWEFPRRTIS
jgi:tripartite-type tricarboxylate transporter receptor subunit TctC